MSTFLHICNWPASYQEVGSDTYQEVIFLIPYAICTLMDHISDNHCLRGTQGEDGEEGVGGRGGRSKGMSEKREEDGDPRGEEEGEREEKGERKGRGWGRGGGKVEEDEEKEME